ncbi:hypothetical protein [Adhaeretor mobilis]|uniref:Uncharacterized protein n=1 Tax=Adhaeretor mobilis TaxID=1930276 RepID=A0A517MYR4_9BACT|nr:hypothetical protein [Adhaeretor mobilis]QDT00007.1 hypothetical protein HG15A2_33420 [Adhaeretor mobilis]
MAITTSTRTSSYATTLAAAFLLATLLLAILPQAAQLEAAVPADSLMSANTRGFASIADMAKLADNWNQTQLGQLVKDEAMKPFVQDMKRQLQRQLSGVKDKLGLELSDLMGVASGEVGLGMVERSGKRASMVMTVDVTGRLAEAEELLEKIEVELTNRKATKQITPHDGIALTIYNVPNSRRDGKTREAVFFIHQEMLCASDSKTEAVEMIARFGNADTNTLTEVVPYQQTMRRCSQESGNLSPELRWFIDPFGYARAVRSLNPGRKRMGKDYLKILTEQGFGAVQGAGGFVNLAVQGNYEILHRTAVYAPATTTGDDKYTLAMRMMNFPNGGELLPKESIPRKLASYRTFNVDLKAAFDNFDSLFDAIAGYDDAFASMIKGLEEDPYGPRVKVRDEFIQHLGQRLTLVTDYELPITTSSERFLFSIDVTNQQAIANAVKKFMEADPDAHLRTLDGHQVWEIMEPEDDFEDLEIGIVEFDPLAPAEPEVVDEAPASGISQASAVCVADGKLMVASHMDFLRKVLQDKPTEETLAGAGDFNEVDAAMRQLLQGAVCARCFIRSDEAYRPTYELLRQGAMPRSKTLLGRVLNRMLTPPEDEDEGILRKQKIDGRTLPSFEVVRRYFSPGGTVVRSDEDGWFVVGAMLSKRQGQARAGSIPSASTSKIR